MTTIAYTRPVVRDHGTLVQLTADIDVNFVGAIANVVMAAISGPMAPTGDGGTAGLFETKVPSGGGVGGAGAGGADPGGDGGLPFTGFAAMLVAAVGAMFTGTGVALRALLRRRSSES